MILFKFLVWFGLTIWTIRGTMGKLSSKLWRNENNTDILYYQIYLPKLASRWFYDFLKAFLMVSLFKLVNSAAIFAFISSLVLHSFVSILLNHTPHIKGDCWGVRWLPIKNIMVAEIFWQPRPCFFLLVWHGVESCCQM